MCRRRPLLHCNEQCESNDPPAEPGAFRLLAPQRGLIATAQNTMSRPKLSFNPKHTAGATSRSLISPESDAAGTQLPGTVKLLLPPRQSRGVSHRTSRHCRRGYSSGALEAVIRKADFAL